MGRYTVTGLCVVAMLSLGALASAGAAWAEAPEFGRCIKKPKAEGAGFSDSKCVRGVSAGAKFEWIPGPGPKAGFTSVERFVFSRPHRQCSLALSEERLAKEEREEAEKASEPDKARLIREAEEHEKTAAEHFASAKLSKEQCEQLLRTEEPKVPVVIATVGGARVICGGSNGSGDYSGPKSLSDVKLAFTECELLSVPFECTTSGAKEGEIVTSSLDGTLGVIAKPELGIKAQDGIDFAAVSGPIAEFTCGPEKFKVTGSVIRELKTDKGLKSEKFKFTQGHGRQDPESFDGQPKDVLLSSINGGKEEQTGLTLRGLLTNEEAIEVNSVT